MFLFYSEIKNDIYDQFYATNYVLIKEKTLEEALDKYLEVLLEEIKEEKFEDTALHLWAKFYPSKDLKDSILYNSNNRIYFYEMNESQNILKENYKDLLMTPLEHKKSNIKIICDTR